MPFALCTRVRLWDHVLDGVQIPMRKSILGQSMPDDILPWAV